MRAERSHQSIPSNAGRPPSASRAGIDAFALPTEVAPILDIDPEIDRWRCLGAVCDEGLVADFKTCGSRGREFRFVTVTGASSFGPALRLLSPHAKVVDPDNVDPVRLENARTILPYSRWRVPLDDRIGLLTAPTRTRVAPEMRSQLHEAALPSDRSDVRSSFGGRGATVRFRSPRRAGNGRRDPGMGRRTP